MIRGSPPLPPHSGRNWPAGNAKHKNGSPPFRYVYSGARAGTKVKVQPVLAVTNRSRSHRPICPRGLPDEVTTYAANLDARQSDIKLDRLNPSLSTFTVRSTRHTPTSCRPKSTNLQFVQPNMRGSVPWRPFEPHSDERTCCVGLAVCLLFLLLPYHPVSLLASPHPAYTEGNSVFVSLDSSCSALHPLQNFCLHDDVIQSACHQSKLLRFSITRTFCCVTSRIGMVNTLVHS